MKIPNVQDAIDQALVKYGANDYVSDVTYLPRDSAPAESATHLLTISSKDGVDKVQIAFTPKGMYGTLLSGLLKFL